MTNTPKTCERCSVPIPPEFQNPLCMECYYKLEEEQKSKQAEVTAVIQQEIAKNPEAPTHPKRLEEIRPTFGILDPNYTENPEADDKDQILANLAQFIYSHDSKKGRAGKLLWYPQRNMYTFIKNWCMKRAMEHPQYPKQIWKPYVVDVGCGSGVGANVLSQEAHFTWGIDKNQWSIEFAKEAFTRERNNYYYSGQLTFDVYDIMVDTRETLKFDVVTAIEVIEHVYDTDTFLKNIITKFAKKDKKGSYNINLPTTYFISTPNRNFHKIRKDRPENIFHVRELRSHEFYKYLNNYFEKVILLNQKGEVVEIDTDKDEVVLAQCSLPKL